jgi:hypothetical protein
VSVEARADREQKVAGIVRFENVEAEGLKTRQHKVTARGDDHGTRGWRQERLDLRGIAGVVEEQEGGLLREHAAVQRGEFAFRDLPQVGLRLEGVDDLCHGVGGRKRWVGGASQVEKDLSVGVTVREFLRDEECEGGLADAAHAGEAADGGARTLAQALHKLIHFGSAAGEVGGRRRERVEGLNRGWWRLDDLVALDHFTNNDFVAADEVIGDNLVAADDIALNGGRSPTDVDSAALFSGLDGRLRGRGGGNIITRDQRDVPLRGGYLLCVNDARTP